MAERDGDGRDEGEAEGVGRARHRAAEHRAEHRKASEKVLFDESKFLTLTNLVMARHGISHR